MKFMNNFKFKAMRRGIIIILMVLIIPSLKSAAQNPNLERLNAFKIAFFTRRLNFSSREAERFWPVYNEYQKQKSILQVERNSIIRSFNQNENKLNDNQLTALGDRLIGTIIQENALAVEFHNKLKEILPPAKVIRFYQVENQYKTQLLNELQGERQPQRVAPGRDL
jgi:hypothetical protein